MATYNDIKKIKIGDNTFVFHVPTATEVGALPSSTTIPAITLNGAANTSPSFYAPTTAGTNGYVLKSNGSGAPTWTSATLTDQKLKVETLTSGTLYYPILATGTGTDTRQIDSTLKGLTYKSTAGTTSVIGTAVLSLGNNTAQGTANNERGVLHIYGKNTYHTILQSDVTGSNKEILLPNKSGTLATTDDITDKKLQVETLASGTMYYPILATGTGTAIRQIDSTLEGLRYESIAGTTSTAGSASLVLGNHIAEGTANNEDGQLVLYGPSGKYGMIVCNSTANRIVELPDQTGTLATTTDIYESVELTQLEYDALSSTDKSDPKKVYFVKDADPSETSELLDMFYPVGTIYETADPDFNPSLTWGGYWEDEEIKDDRIVEEETSGIWFYRKWSSGRAECWGYKFTTGTFATWSSHYSCALPEENLPSGLFNSSPYWIVSGRCTTCDTVCGLASSGGSSTRSPAVVLIRPAAASGSLNFQAFYHATGTWKTYEAPTTIYKWKRIN